MIKRIIDWYDSHPNEVVYTIWVICLLLIIIGVIKHGN